MTKARFDATGDHKQLAWLALVPPTLLLVFLLDGVDILWALPVGVVVAWLSFEFSDGDVEVTLVAGVLGLMFVGSVWAAAAGVVLLLAILLAVRLRSVWVLLAGAVGFLAPGSVGPWVVAATVALMVAWTGPGAARRPGGAALVVIVAIGVTVLAGVWFEPAWVGVVGLLAGGLARATALHPANLGAGRLLATGGGVAAVAPPAAMLVFASLDRVPALLDVATVTVAFGLAAVGLLVFAFGLGAELALRSSGPAKGALLGGGFAFGSSVAAAGAAAGFDAATVAAMALWPLVCPAMAVGILRVVRRLGWNQYVRVALWGLVILAGVGARVLR